jgi:hypothetical protein
MATRHLPPNHPVFQTRCCCGIDGTRAEKKGVRSPDTDTADEARQKRWRWLRALRRRLVKAAGGEEEFYRLLRKIEGPTHCREIAQLLGGDPSTYFRQRQRELEEKLERVRVRFQQAEA